MKSKIDDRLILMISSPYGYKYYNINAFFKHSLIYLAVFIASMAFLSLVVLYSFSAEIKDIDYKYKYIQEEYAKLVSHHIDLTAQITAKKEETLLVSDKIEELEGEIGISKSEGYGLKGRVETASITGLQKLFIMKFIPNGIPLTSYKRISSPYGYRIHPLSNTREIHTGTDLAADKDTPVYATADGVVDFAQSGWNGGYGTLVKIDHSFGFRTYYAHLNGIAVKKGEFVRKGQLIAYVGNTGASSGNHLHYEVRFLGAHINPKNFLEWNMGNFDIIFKKEKNIAWQSLLQTINNLMQHTPMAQQSSLLGQKSKAS
ncbi:M23 family metallopeptidase [Helicobacter sp. 23-1044]